MWNTHDFNILWNRIRMAEKSITRFEIYRQTSKLKTTTLDLFHTIYIHICVVLVMYREPTRGQSGYMPGCVQRLWCVLRITMLHIRNDRHHTGIQRPQNDELNKPEPHIKMFAILCIMYKSYMVDIYPPI